jgi:hypothetical protein
MGCVCLCWLLLTQNLKCNHGGLHFVSFYLFIYLFMYVCWQVTEVSVTLCPGTV